MFVLISAKQDACRIKQASSETTVKSMLSSNASNVVDVFDAHMHHSCAYERA